MPIFRFDNRDIHYELYGEPGQPVITLVNGLSMRTSHWAPYFKRLPELGCRVLSYDMIGQGASSKPILGVSFDDHAVMLKALHEHLAIENPYVMGISFGGVVALKYAHLYPDALAGLIPASTFSELDPQLTGHARNLYIGMARVGFEFYLDLLMPLNFTNTWMGQNQNLIEVIKRVGVASNELFGIQNLMESLAEFESITPKLAGVRCPTLILNAEFDSLTPRHLHDLIRLAIPGSKLVIVPKMAHAFTLEVPELTARLLADFVHEVEQGRWVGDQSVWLAAEDPKAEPLLVPYHGEHLRWTGAPTGKPTTGKPTAAAQPAARKKPAAPKAATKPAARKAAAKTTASSSKPRGRPAAKRNRGSSTTG
ncbi:alpha/beta fold hydrolase [Alkalilimnicola sp. S0819]|uniref:alpha/beta fold hydrolase n=1 Tax=Alkalilimnicola sp. S0819 TaxID=2613922 RepID=UPI001262164D|nr:alpha/beta hydrolase [Alkalilimnicola sp. S0819]KAB7622674.1 alpha/beta hydrolase [Alkalilimnicola sp. S0819]MPQ17311.1 alpha/beta fold hydrolase [Alkalilimnicola sp. S0819]